MLQQLRRRFQELQGRIAAFRGVQQEMGRLSASLREAEAARAELVQVREQVQALERRLRERDYARPQQERSAQLEAALQELGYDAREHQQLRRLLQQLRDAPRRWEQLQNTQENLNNARASLRQLQEQARRLEEKGEEIAAQERFLEDVGRKLPVLSAAIQEQEAACRSLNERNERLLREQGFYRSRLEHCARLARQIAELQEQGRNLQFEQGLYEKLALAFGKDGIQALIIENVIPEIEREANNILSRLSANQTQVSIEALRDKKGGGQQETLDIKISDELGTRSYELYSGGEGFRINFALRIALSKLLAQRAGFALRTLVIDEGFGTQDREGLDHLIEAIESVRADFDKVIVVTHLDVIKEAFPVTIRVSKSPDLGSSFQIIA